MDFNAKILFDTTLRSWREELRRQGKKLVITNGCFDILHLGHVSYLQAARNCGGALLVGVNSDESVRQLKGEGRPINIETDRARIIAALEAVDGVYVFQGLRATDFLAQSKPDIYVKGSDYTIDSIPQDERRIVESVGGQIIFLPFIPGKSTTSLLKKLQ